MRGIEDTAFTGVVSISTTLGRYFVKGDLSLTRLHQLRGVGDAKVLKSLGRSSKGRHYRG